MPVNLKNRSLLDVTDLSPAEFRFLLDLARDLKRSKRAGAERPRLAGRNLCIVFEKTSTRTGAPSKSRPTTRGWASPTSTRPAPRSATRSR